MGSSYKASYRDKTWRAKRVERLVGMSHPNATHVIQTTGGGGGPIFYQVIVYGKAFGNQHDLRKIDATFPRYHGLPIKEFGSFIDGAIEALDGVYSILVKCALCDNPMLTRDSHNAAPVFEGGRCCETCNWSVVIPARMLLLGAGDEAKK